jgi:putative glutamine amidotransferase
MGKPRIGVTRWEDVPPEALDRYHSRVIEAGGDVVDINEDSISRVGEIVGGLNGLVLTGGIDVEPSVYGAERHAKVKETAEARDRLEIEVLLAAASRDMPVLAICRGHQLMNVAFGGTLLQHIDSGEHRADFRTEGYPSRWHDVSIDAGSRLAEALGETRLWVNSRHHQAVQAPHLAPGLRPVAYAAEHQGELIEGMESDEHRWIVGVQWHPERPEAHEADFAPAMRKLFEAFIDQTRR